MKSIIIITTNKKFKVPWQSLQSSRISFFNHWKVQFWSGSSLPVSSTVAVLTYSVTKSLIYHIFLFVINTIISLLHIPRIFLLKSSIEMWSSTMAGRRLLNASPWHPWNSQLDKCTGGEMGTLVIDWAITAFYRLLTKWGNSGKLLPIYRQIIRVITYIYIFVFCYNGNALSCSSVISGKLLK